MDFSQLGKGLIIAGAVIVVVGLVLVFAGKIPFLGKLPGDVVWKRGNFTLYFPIVTSIVLSILATLIFYLVSRFTRQ